MKEKKLQNKNEREENAGQGHQREGCFSERNPIPPARKHAKKRMKDIEIVRQKLLIDIGEHKIISEKSRHQENAIPNT